MYTALLISRTGPTSNQLERGVQYTFRLFKAKPDSTPNEPVPSREILVRDIYIFFLYICLHQQVAKINRL